MREPGRPANAATAAAGPGPSPQCTGQRDRICRPTSARPACASAGDAKRTRRGALGGTRPLRREPPRRPSRRGVGRPDGRPAGAERRRRTQLGNLLWAMKQLLSPEPRIVGRRVAAPPHEVAVARDAPGPLRRPSLQLHFVRSPSCPGSKKPLSRRVVEGVRPSFGDREPQPAPSQGGERLLRPSPRAVARSPTYSET
jgi:hypothetical protein